MKIMGIFLGFLSFCTSLIAQENQPPAHFITFIMPCYNCEKTVEESIDSIYQQDLAYPFELVCTDDASVDGTRSLLEKCAQKYPNLIIYTHEKNRGGGAARNTCIAHGHGDLIFCLDSDNVLCPNSVGPLVELIDKSGCDIAAFDCMRFFKGDYQVVANWIYSSPNNILDLASILRSPKNVLRNNPAHSGNYLFTRKSFERAGGYPADCGALDTAAFGLMQLITGCKIALLPNTFYWHRIHDNNYWDREEKNNKANFIKVLRNISEVFSEETYDFIWDDVKVNAAHIWDMWNNNEFRLASPLLIDSLFRAYNYKVEGEYRKASQEFAAAIRYGCKSEKIDRYMREMAEQVVHR